ncbi:MAG: 3'-5' exonuclease [Erysipelotrichaceae bacterium]
MKLFKKWMKNDVCKVVKKQNKKIVVYDTETTGLDFDTDEIVQLSIIDFDTDEVLYNQKFKPINKHPNYAQAEKITGIKLSDLQDCPSFDSCKKEIQKIFDDADILMAYNIDFDNGMLATSGISGLDEKKQIDVMIKFAEFYGELRSDGELKWKKLSFASEYFGFKFNYHDSLEDIKATKMVYNEMLKLNFNKDIKEIEQISEDNIDI